MAIDCPARIHASVGGRLLGSSTRARHTMVPFVELVRSISSVLVDTEAIVTTISG